MSHTHTHTLMLVCVSSPAARRSLRRRVLGSVLGGLLHHGSGCFCSGSCGRDQSRQRGVSVKPGNPLLQGNLTSSGLGQAWLSIRTEGVIVLFLSQFRVFCTDLLSVLNCCINQFYSHMEWNLKHSALCQPSLTCLRLLRTSSVWSLLPPAARTSVRCFRAAFVHPGYSRRQRNAAVCCSHSLMAKVKRHL